MAFNKYDISLSSSSSSTNAPANNGFSSAVEEAILKSNNPLEVEEAEELTVVGQTGKWINKQEILKWLNLK